MLQFNSNGEFRILILADIQDGKPLDKNKQNKLAQLISKSTPELIILLGDMIFGPVVRTEKKTKEIIDTILEPIEASGIPFAFVTGNHDTDSRVKVSRQMEMYSKSAQCLTPMIADRMCSGSYSLSVLNDNKPAVQLIFHDSGSTHITLRGILYDPVSEEQLKFEREALEKNKDIPAYIFQHIPVPEIYELINVSDQKTDGSVKQGNILNRKYLTLKDPRIGTLGEHPCPPERNASQFQNWARNGNVKAAVFGHDHMNSFCGEVDGISMIQTACAGLTCYGDDNLRGGRIITIRTDGSFTTEELIYKKM